MAGIKKEEKQVLRHLLHCLCSRADMGIYFSRHSQRTHVASLPCAVHPRNFMQCPICTFLGSSSSIGSVPMICKEHKILWFFFSAPDSHSWSEQLRHDPKPYFTVPVYFSISQKILPELQDFYFAFILLQYT